MTETIWLQRPGEDVPWGFRLHGGRDFQQALTVQKVNAGSIAATGLSSGDVITRIGETDTAPLTHTQAMQTIKNSGNMLQLRVSKGGGAVSGLVSPKVLTTAPRYENQTSGDYGSNNSYPFANDPVPDYPQYNSNPMSFSQSSANGQSGFEPDDQFYDSTIEKTPPVKSPQRMPDAILNMAAKGEGDKKPFSYVPDVNALQEQRNRVRKKTPVSTLPRYQHMLNMPQFEEPKPIRMLQRTSSVPESSEPSDTAMVANLQFNTPLGMYSGENVVEALKGQTKSSGVVTDVVGVPKKDKGDITQSAVYKMIHGIDQPQQKPRAVPIEVQGQSHGGDSGVHDEVRFTGLNRSTSIPSKTYQQLEVITNRGGSEIDTTSILHNTGRDHEVGDYNEKSIRYTGKNIPSKSFRMLQSMTGGANSSSPVPTTSSEPASDDEARWAGRQGTPTRLRATPTRSLNTPTRTLERPQDRHPSPEIDTTSIRHNLLAADDQVGDYNEKSIRYTGKNIPSKSFRMLQSLTGEGDGSTQVILTPNQPVRRPPQQRRQPPQHQPPHHQPPHQPPTHQQQLQQQQWRPQPHQVDTDEHQNSDAEAAASNKRYVGGSIPSHSFRMLQQSIGTNDSASDAGSDTLSSTEGRRVKVVRLRTQASMEDTGASEF